MRTVSFSRRSVLRRAAIIRRRARESLLGLPPRSGSALMIAAKAVVSAVATLRATTAQCLTDSNCSSDRDSTGVRCHAAATRNIGFMARASATLRLASATSLSDALMSGAGSTVARRASASFTSALASLSSSACAFWAAAFALTASAWTAAPQFHEPRRPAHVRPSHMGLELPENAADISRVKQAAAVAARAAGRC